MADRIQWTAELTPEDPRFYTADPTNLNTNISASKYDPTDPTSVGNPVGEKYNEFLKTANIGDTFDWGDGTKSQFTGFNQMGTPIIQTVESAARQNWRETMSGSATFQEAVNKLKAAGYDTQMAESLVRSSGTEWSATKSSTTGLTPDGKTVSKTIKNADGTSTVMYNDGTSAVFPAGAIVPTVGTSSTAMPLTAKEQVDRNNAIASLTATFNAMGLGSEIASAITDMVQKGYTTDTIMMIAQDPSSKDPVALAFQKRFSGNAARIKAGLAPLAPAEYIATERAYRQVIEASGLPKGFYDSQDDYTKFIANDVSPTELKARVDTAADAIANADPFYTNSLKSMYGLTTGDMIAHALDPQLALPLLQKQTEAVKIGTAAARQGWGISATGAENLYAQGVSAAQAAQGFKTVAGMQTDQQRLAEIWGGDAAAQGQNLVAGTFGTAGAAYADQQIKALQQKEINAFSGASGVAKGSLGVSTEQTGGNL
jgi:hypothetical protein